MWPKKVLRFLARMLLSSARTLNNISRWKDRYHILIWVKNSLEFAVCLTAPMTNFSSWQMAMPLYNSSEVLAPGKQYGNTTCIHSPWILKRLNVTHYCAFVYFWSHRYLQAKSLFSSDSSQRTIIEPYIKGAVSRNSATLGNYKMPVKLRETWK